jgi:RNase P/RNase MRP subunit POP5
LQVRCFEGKHTGLCVVRCARDTARQVSAALALTTKVGAVTVACRVVRVAGSARTLRPAATKAFRASLSRAAQDSAAGLSEEKRQRAEAAFSDALQVFEN